MLRRHAQLAPAHLVDELVGGVPRLDLVPAGELAAQGRVDLAQELLAYVFSNLYSNCWLFFGKL